ncbi:J domain-containing protein [bacterium]|nr:J domain-containing protein [bacterium]
MSNKDYYQILGVNLTATEAEIKTAYRRLARKYHPDVAGNTPDAIKKFKEITEAYETLTDKEKRKNYDALRGLYTYGQETKSTSGTRPNFDSKRPNFDSKRPNFDSKRPNFDNKKTTNDNKTNTNKTKEKDGFTNAWESFIDGINKGVKNVNEELNKEKQKKENKKSSKEEKIIIKNGSDINTEITISISEAINGVSKTLNILHTEPCPNCLGRTFINGSNCKVCNGKGEISNHKKIVVKIPARVKNGSKIRLSGEGNPGLNGGKPGDLYILIKIENDEEIKYDGLNVLKTVTVTPEIAVLGGLVEVPVSTGVVSMKVMPSTNNGQKYRIAGEGLIKDGKKGDMIVTVIIDIPKKLSDEEIELYKKLKTLSENKERVL